MILFRCPHSFAVYITHLPASFRLRIFICSECLLANHGSCSIAFSFQIVSAFLRLNTILRVSLVLRKAARLPVVEQIKVFIGEKTASPACVVDTVMTMQIIRTRCTFIAPLFLTTPGLILLVEPGQRIWPHAQQI